jgi:hypothetical protein
MKGKVIQALKPNLFNFNKTMTYFLFLFLSNDSLSDGFPIETYVIDLCYTEVNLQSVIMF